MPYAPHEWTGSEIAIVGMACRFPGATNPNEFWQFLRDGVETIRFFSDEELLAAGVDPELLHDPDYVKAAGVMEGVDRFDAGFFGYTPREAATLDPQQRFFLLSAWEALENAGCNPLTTDLAIGVFAGIGQSGYLLQQLEGGGFASDPAARFSLMTGNDKDFLATRVAYKLNLRGPAFTVQTACSTSLVAVHLACQSLLNGECDMSLAGGVSLRIPNKAGYLYQEGMILSPDGHCRAFDASAKGTVPGDGVGIVVLKRLEDALESGDTIHAVIRGSAINNDGSAKIGYTAPSAQGQSAVISEALAVAGVEPEEIGYLEAHGTGTTLGDPIEIEALNRVFAPAKRKPATCPIGSVKSNIGHTDAAAGVASLIKTVLSLRHRHIPPSLHFVSPNPNIRFADGPFYVNDRLTPWEPINGTRYAGISSFGIGGTNAHVVLQEAPLFVDDTPATGSLHLLTLSAKSDEALVRLAERYADTLIQQPTLSLPDLCYTARVGRVSHEHALSLVAKDNEELHELLRGWVTGNGSEGVQLTRKPGNNPRLAFLFTGQGSQSIRMGEGLFRSEPLFRDVMQKCSDAFEPHLGGSLVELLYPSEEGQEEAATRLQETGWTQPALFALEYSLAKLWQSRGVEPSVLLGHSIGEIVAACLAGVFNLDDAITLVAHRARLMQALPHNGLMATLFAAEEMVQEALEPFTDRVSIAARNAPGSVVISGEAGAVEKVCEQLGKKGKTHRLLKVSHAFHSPLMEPMLDEFGAAIRALNFHSPHIPIVSNLSGRIAGGEIATYDYWVRQVREIVRFVDGIETLLASEADLFLEVGPRPVLSQLGQLSAEGSGKDVNWIPSLQPGLDDERALLLASGGLAALGVQVDPACLGDTTGRRRIELPTYPFEEVSHWIASNRSTSISASQQTTFGQPLSPVPMELWDNTQGITMNNQAVGFAERRAAVLQSLMDEVKSISGVVVAVGQQEENLFHLGLDSLMLVRIRQAVVKQFGVNLPMSQFYSELDSLAKIADAVAQQSPSAGQTAPLAAPAVSPAGGGNGSPTRTPVAVPAPSQPQARIPASGDASMVERVAAMQIEEMSRFMAHQLEVLSGVTGVAVSQAESHPVQPATKPKPTKKAPEDRPQNLSMFQNFEAEVFTAEQQAFIDNLIARYIKRTPKSKASIETHRPWFSDWINAVNFRFSLKEILYPIVAHTSKGSRLWDIDGNEYLDMAMGYGVNFLGNRPDFVEKAIEKQLHEGIQLGPQFDMTGETARMLCELTGVERVTFTNTGTEAMMVAVRIARSATNRKKIVVFQGSYHGMFDGLMVAPTEEGTVPAFPGIPEGMVEDVVMLNYGSEDSLEIIRKLGSELAAVVVEPVQSRRPGFQPRDYLHELRRIADEIGCALVFDEIITGFRICPGGAQEYFDVRADIVAYGKVVGGGMPVGIIAGKASFMDMIDGGSWRYGDRSHPESGTTIFAGTFCKHPLTIASMHAVLTHLLKEGPQLQERVNAKAARLVDTLNDYFIAENVPVRIRRFASQFRFESFGEYDLAKNPIEMELFFYILMMKGIYTWERHICFLSTQHTDEDVDRVIQASKEAITELRAGGFSFTTTQQAAVR